MSRSPYRACKFITSGADVKVVLHCGIRPGFLLAEETRRDTQILPFYHFVLSHRSLSLMPLRNWRKVLTAKNLNVFLLTMWKLIRIPAPQWFNHTCDAAASSESFSEVASLVRVTVLCLSSGPQVKHVNVPAFKRAHLQHVRLSDAPSPTLHSSACFCPPPQLAQCPTGNTRLPLIQPNKHVSVEGEG